MGQKGCGKVLLGEVFMVNDDRNSNRFNDMGVRFPAIIKED